MEGTVHAISNITLYMCIYNLYIIYVVPKTSQIVSAGVQEADEPSDLGEIFQKWDIFMSLLPTKKMKKEIFKFL